MNIVGKMVKLPKQKIPKHLSDCFSDEEMRLIWALCRRDEIPYERVMAAFMNDPLETVFIFRSALRRR